MQIFLRDSVFCLCYNLVVPILLFSNFSHSPNPVENQKVKIEFFKNKSFYYNMSTTRSQKRKNTQREADDNVSEGFVSPINSHPLDQNVELAGPSRPKSPRVENSFLESIRSSLKEEITSEIKTLLLESQKEMLKLLRPETRENIRDHVSEELENETRSFYTPTKTVRNNSTQNEDHSIIRNMVTGVLNDSTNQPKRTKIQFQSQPPSKERPAKTRTLFAPDQNNTTMLPMPKALTASLPTFDGKSEKFELFEISLGAISKCIRTLQKYKR